MPIPKQKEKAFIIILSVLAICISIMLLSSIVFSAVTQTKGNIQANTALLIETRIDFEILQKDIQELENALSETKEYIETYMKKMEATAYTHTGNQTFTGTWPKVGTVAVDPEVIPLGSKGYVVGYGPITAEDTGRLIKGNIIDLFMETEEECWQWGRKEISVIWFPET